MKKGEKSAENVGSELLKELQILREQAKKSTLLEQENQHLKKKLKDTEQKWENSEREIEKLKFLLFEANYQISQWKKRFFGSTGERFVPSYADQLVLDLELIPLAQIPDTEPIKVEYIRNLPSAEDKKKPGRMLIPEHLKREVIEIHPEGDLSGMVYIGKQITERLEVTPQVFKVIQEIRHKYMDVENDRKIITPALPERALFKAIAGPALLADILVSKYVDSLPVTRQLSRFARMGVHIAKSTVNGWIKNSCEFLEPLYELHISAVLSSNYLQVDETPVKVLDQSKDAGIRKSYHWVYYSPPDKLVMFDFQQGRDKTAPQKYLKNFKGTLQTDAYAGYNQFDAPGVTMVGCLAHSRRKFADAQDNDPKARIALAEFQQLYAIEHNAKVKGLDAGQLKKERKQKAAPILNRLRLWMENYRLKTTPSSPMGKAIGYFMNNWKKLTAYLNDGKTLIDNNSVERSIRVSAVGKRNYLFHGSHEGGCWAAMLYSFFGTCKLHQINPLEWLTDVLTRMPLYAKDKIQELLPQNWSPLTVD
jgi:transposase